MPGYSFQPRFVEPIRVGTKGGTIRAPRRMPAKWSQWARDRHPGGHARVGDPLYLWCKLRTPQAFPICQRSCCAAEPITLDFSDRTIDLDESLYRLSSPELLDRFAIFDGFESFDEMRQFWSGADRFEGWHIRWLELPHF